MSHMKFKFYLVAVCLFVASNVFSQEIELGAGAGFGTHIKALSFNFRALYELPVGIEVGPDFHFSLKNKASDEFIDYALTRKEYSIHARYMLDNIDIFDNTTFYPLVGVSLINLKFTGGSNFSDNPILQVEDDADLFLGAYFGLGAKYKLNSSISFFGEIRYHVSKEPQTVFNAGIVYPIKLPFVVID